MAIKTIVVKRGTAADLASENPVLAAGEPCYETDTGRRKTGDGVKAYNALGYEDEMNLAEVDLSEEATDADKKKGFNVYQAKALKSALDNAAHDVSSDVVDASGAPLTATETDATTGTSIEAAKALAGRVNALEDDAVIDGGVVTSGGSGGSDGE